MELTASNQMNSKLSSLQEDYTAEMLKTIFEQNNLGEIDKLVQKYNNDTIINSIFQHNMFANNPYVFKNSNKFNFYKNLFDNCKFKTSYIDNYSSNFIMVVLSELVSINKGQYILNKLPLKEMFNVLNDDDKNTLYFTAGVSGTLPTFLIIDKMIVKKNFVDIYNKSILSAVCRNADDRLLKYIIKNFDSYHFNFQSDNNEQFVICIINQIFSPHIPHKYTLRRLKMINSKINLKPYFSQMVRVVHDVDMFEKIYKYYNDSKSITVDYNINLSSVIGYTDDNSKEKIIRVLNILENSYDKYIFLLQSYMDFFDMGNSYINVSEYYLEEFNDNSTINKFHDKFINCFFVSSFENIFNKEFVRNFSCVFSNINFNNFSMNFSSHFPKIKPLIFFLPFVPFYPKRHPSIIKLNLVRHCIKVWLRKRNKIVKIMKRIENFNFKEKNITPFTKVPPRHCVPFELESIKGTDEGYYLISEKADGCLVDFIPNTVEPLIEEYTTTNIKAEFIEDLDLYLIFDTNVEMSVLDRYDGIRKAHPHTCKNKSIRQRVVHDYEDLKSAISYERTIFEEFLKQPYKNYRVYPKATWLVTDPTKFNKELVEKVIEEEDSEFICNEGPYQNDGMIITPLDGSREIKVKPKSLHTIDLLYSNGWKDREGKLWNNFIKTNIKPRNNVIMRCHPKFYQENGNWIFEPVEVRLDKTKPNTNKVVKMIYGLHSINWKNLYIGANSYYSKEFQEKEKSKSWQDVIYKQNCHLKSTLLKIGIEPKSSWLDLGCGSGRLVKFLKEYLISSYVGMDYDMKQLIRGTHMTDNNYFLSQNCRFIHCNLKDDWNTSPTSIDFLSSDEKFDYIISNHSIAHFYDYKFWEKLDKVSNKGSIFIFNVVNSNIETRWISGKDYMLKDDNVIKYKFTSVHNEEMTEPFINESSIHTNLNEYGWKVVSKDIPLNNDLDSKYTWYVVKKS